MKRYKLFFEIILVLIILYVFYCIPSLLPVKNIICNSNNNTCSERIANILRDYQVKDLRSAKKDLSQLLKNDVSIDKYHLQYRINGDLQVNIVENISQFSISNTNNQWKVMVGKDGVALSVSEDSSLPTLFVDGNLPNLGYRVDDKILFALNILDSLSKRQKVKYAKYSANELVIDMDNGLKVIFPVEGEIKLLLGSYFLIENNLKNLNKDSELNNFAYNILDLRFKDPVLRKNYDEK